MLRRARTICLSLALLALPSVPVAHADPRVLVGAPAPELRARALDSDAPFDLAAHRGRVVVLAFFATWCGACRRIAPDLEAMGRAHPEVVVLGVSHESRERLRRHVATYPLLQCTGRTARRYHALALPTIVVVDGEGVVRAAYQGADEELVRNLRAEVVRLSEQIRR